MSTTQTATTTLYVNGRPAQEEIGRLRGTLDKLKKDLQDIAKDQNQGINSPAWKKVQAEIKKTEKELGWVQSGVANVKQTMVSLDKATPKQLRKALKELKAELEGIARGEPEAP